MMLFVLAGVLATSAGEGSQTPAGNVDLRCGSYCLFICMHALGADTLAFSELERELGQPSSKGYSLGQLADVARKRGFHCLGVVTSADNLMARNRPFACIARIDNAHFVTIGNIQDHKATVFDPPRTYDLPVDTLRTRWDGTALLISTRPLVAEEELGVPSSELRPIVFGCVLALAAIAVLAFIYGRRITK